MRILLLLGSVAALMSATLLFMSSGAQADTMSNPPVISSIAASSTDTGATITWNTDQQADGQVLYGSTTSYNASSTLITTLSTGHTAFLGGLTPNTTYHYQIVSANASGTVATSSDQTFTTASTTATSTPADTTQPTLSGILASSTGTSTTNIIWQTNEPATSQVFYGFTNAYGSMSMLDTSLVENHSVTLMGLAPNTLYHYQVWSSDVATNTASSSDYTFTTLPTTSTSTPPTGSSTIDMLQAQIDSLKNRVSILEGLVAWLMGNTGGGTTTPPTGGTGILDQNGITLTAGHSIDLVGHNFGHEESVLITLGSTTVATAHADGGGNFSTGSFAGPTSPGTYTYTATGQTSGITANATITVVNP